MAIRKFKGFNVNNFLIAKILKESNRCGSWAGRYSKFHLTPKYTEVTDGYSLFRIGTVEAHDDAWEKILVWIKDSKKVVRRGFDVVIPLQNALEIYDMMRKKDGPKFTWLSGNKNVASAVFEFPDKSIILKPDDEPFVNTKGLWPEMNELKASVVFNPELVRNVANRFVQADIRWCEFSINKEKEKVMRFIGQTTEGQGLNVVLMPMKRDVEDSDREL